MVGDAVLGDPESYALEGHELLTREDYRAAEAAFREALRLDPDRADYHVGLGRALLSQKRYEAAEKAFSEAVGLRPDRAEHLAGLGDARLGQRHYPEAEEAYSRATSLETSRPDYYAGLGQAMLGQGYYEAGEDAFRRAVELQPDNAEYCTGLERARLGRERYEAAARATVSNQATAEPEIDGQGGQDWTRRLRRYIGLNQPDEGAYQGFDAESLVGEFADSPRPVLDDAQSRANVGHALLVQQRYVEAEAAFREAVNLRPGQANYQAALGHALLGQQRYREAGRQFRAAANLAPDRADYLSALGQARMGQGDYSEAGGAFSEAVRIAPDCPDYLSSLGHARLGEERHSEAETAFRQALDLQPECVDALDGLGRSLLGQQRYRDAEAIFSKAATIQPSTAAHIGGVGQALLGQERYDEAEAAFRKAIALQSDRADNQAGLGEALLGRGQYSEAETAFSAAVKLQPGNAYYHAGLGHARAGIQEYSSAEVEFRSAASLDPYNLTYQASLGKALLCQGNIEAAQSVLDEAVALDPGAEETVGLRQAIAEAYDDALISHILQRARVALETAKPDISTIQPDRYLDHVKSLSLQNISGIREPFREWRTVARNASLGSKRLAWMTFPTRLSRHTRVIALILLVPGFSVAANYVINSLTGRYNFPMLKSYTVPFSALSCVGAIALLLALAAPAIRSRRVRSGALPLDLLRDRLDTLITNIILDPAITAAHGVIWRDSAEDIVAVADGPQLSTKAEPDNIVATEAFRRLAKSLARSHGAAVGIAGPRGSGKTELARAFTELGLHRSPARTIPLMLWAPVKYDAQTFLLRLLKELCINIISVGCGAPIGSDPMFAAHRRQRVNIVFLASATVVTVGALLIISKVSTFDSRMLSSPILFGGILIVVGFSAILLEWSSGVGRPPLPMRGDVMSPKTIELASELRTRVEFTETYTKGSTIGISGKAVAATATTGTQLARIPLNEIDVVRELRNMVDRLAADDWQVIIAIDELDKISDDNEALEFLNHVKVLFPIHECSFIVSVSQNAWSLFECRGLPLRNAFDSSFDEIVPVGMLQPKESRDLLKRRCRDITDAQALFCHCLSGGLPRDLLRSARFLARIASSWDESGRTSPPSLSNVLEELFNEDLMTKATAVRHGIPGQPEDLSAMGHEQLLAWIDSQCSGIASEIQPDPKLIRAYVSFLHTLRKAFTPGGPLSELDETKGFDHPLISEGFELIAKARRSLDRDVSTTYELLERAKRALGIGDSDLARS